ncbi:hypothetical protein PSHT_06204 [Puccinia striiformis]|uniref:Uncharacterized protein n=1 Tax=Puccinia striiformis TaxID=27350 RepID=A0A2S4W8L7_9BASI|nr:hypothetical protein PSHT_06204 [Puccinia striiformis]
MADVPISPVKLYPVTSVTIEGLHKSKKSASLLQHATSVTIEGHPLRQKPRKVLLPKAATHHRRPPQKAAPQQPPTTSRDFSHHRRPPQRVVPRQRPALSSSRPERPKGIVFCVDNLPQEVEDLGGAGTPLVPFYVKDLKELPSFGGSDTSL